MLRHCLVVCLIMSLLMLMNVGCGEGSTQRPQTVREYAKLICNSGDMPSGATWKQAKDYMKDRIKTMERVIPPASVRDYHMVGLALLKAGHDFARGQDGNEIANEYELVGDEKIMVLGMAAVEAEESLPSRVRHTLEEYGCS